MEKFIIKKIEADFDERWLRVKKNGWWKRIWYIFHGIFRRCFYDEQY